MSRKPTEEELSQESKRVKDTADSFHLIKVLAYGLIVGIFTVSAALQSNAFLSMWRVPTAGDPLSLLRIILFVELIALAVMWIAATEAELQLWIQHLDVPYIRWEVYAAMFGLAVLLGLFFVFVYNIVLISGFLAIYFLFNYWTQWLANDHFRRALRKTKSRVLRPEDEQILKVMERYWMARPQLGRIATMMFFSTVSVNLAVYGAMKHDSAKEWWQSFAYGILILTLLVGESFIAYWRRVRERDIEEIIVAAEELQYASISG